MGTRGLTAVMADGKYQIAQYGQWDHYPSGQGITALEFCREHLSVQEGRDAFKAKLANVKFSEVEAELEGSTYEREVSDFSSLSNGTKTKKIQYPYGGRDTGAEILELVFKSTGMVCTGDMISFAGESLFCEYAYVVDLDKNTLEVFQGFNQRKLGKTQRFKDYFQMVERRGENQYHPVRLLKKYKLSDLPSNEAFLADLEEKDEDALPAAEVVPTMPKVKSSEPKLLKGGFLRAAVQRCSVKIEVMVFEPGKPGESRMIDDSLEAMQAVVGGFIEHIGLILGLAVICNEDGRRLGLEANRWGFLGTFFVVRQNGSEYVSLTEDDWSLVAQLEREREATRSGQLD